METTAIQQDPREISFKQAASPLNMAIGGAVLLIGGYFAYNHFKNAQLDSSQTKQDDKAAGDQPTNIANQIYAENRSSYTSDDKIIGLFNQISDYKATKDAYTNVSRGSDILADTEKHVHASTYQQILNIIGVNGGGKKATSQVVKEVTKPKVKNAPLQTKWIVAKVDSRIRKTPVAISATSSILHFKSNIIATAKINTVIGFIDTLALVKNGNKPFYDSKHDTYFLPVKAFDSKDKTKTYTVYVAASTVDSYDKMPDGSTLLRINESVYESAIALSGLANINYVDMIGAKLM